MFPLLRLISLRHLLRSPLRSVLTVLGVAVGVATLVGVTAINRSVMDAFRSTVDTIAGRADLSIAATALGFDEGLTETVKAVPGVLHATGQLSETLPVSGSPGESLYVMGVDVLDDGYFRTYEGVDRDVGQLSDDLEFLNSTDRVLLSERFAREHKLKTGDTFSLVTSTGAQPFTVHALIKETGPVKAFGGSVAIMYLGSAQEAFHRSRIIDRIDVAVDPKRPFEEVRDALRAKLGPGFEVERPSRRGGSVEKMVRSFQMGLNLGSGVALLVGVFLVYNTVAIGVVQRRREIGTLRALGGTKLRLRGLFTLEAVVLGAVGTALGLPFGVVVARGAISVVSEAISSLYVQVHATDVQVGSVELTLGILLGLLGSALAALRPAVVASRVQPVEALRRDMAAGADVNGLASAPVVIGVVCAVLVYPTTLLPAPVENLPVAGYVAVFFAMMAMSLLSPLLLRALRPLYARPAEWLLGISGRLAADNFARAPGRTAVPVAALALGVAMAVGIAGFIGSFQASSDAWIDQSVPADLFITSAAKMGGVQNTPMQPGLADELAKLPGVRAVDRVRVFSTDLLGLRIYVISLLPEIHSLRDRTVVLEGKMPTKEQRRARTLTISENLSKRRGLHPGDGFDMSTPTGVHHYTVGAVVIDYTSDQGTVFLDREIFIRDFADDRVDTFELYLDDLSHADQVRRTVTERWGQSRSLFVLTNAELRAEAKSMVEAAFSITYAMEAVAILLALLGVVNTLLAAVLDRTREIGLLRAVGAARSHIVRLFVGEATFIGLSGGLLGVATGVVMGLIVTKVIGDQATGWSFPYVFPLKLAVQMVSAATGCALLAGIYPAGRAAQMDVVEALAYE